MYMADTHRTHSQPTGPLPPPSYKELVQLHDKYAGQGLVIMAFPCNQVSVRVWGYIP